MRTFRPFALAVLLAASAFAEDATEAGPKEREVNIEGRVVLPNGIGLVGARVFLVNMNPLPFGKTRTVAQRRSGRRGAFRFRAIVHESAKTPDVYGIVALAPEWGPGFAMVRSKGKQKPFPAAPLVVRLCLPRTIVGKAEDAEGNPLSGVTVSALRFIRFDRAARRYAFGFFPAELFTATTDAHGDFAIEHLPAGPWVTTFVRASCKSYATEEMAVRPSPPSGRLRIVMVRAGGLCGTVRYEDGRCAAQARVTAQARSGTRPYTLTDRDGHYVLADLKPGVYTVRVVSPQRSPAWRAAPAVGINVGPDETTTNVDLVLVRATTVRGVVVDKETGTPVAGVRISGRDSAGGGTATTDADGMYALRCLPGQLQVRVVGVPKGFARPAYNLARNVLAVRGETVDGIDFIIEGACRLAGAVLGLDGRGLPGVQLRACLPSRTLTVRRSDEDGRFLFDALPPVECIVLYATDTDDKLAAVQTVNFGGELEADAEVRLRPAPIVRGRMVDAAGRPVPKAWVSAALAQRQFGPSIANTRTGPDGRYELVAVPGVRLRVRASRWLKQFRRTVHTEEGKTYDLHDFVTKAGTTISGHVLSPQGKPVRGALVTTFASPTGGRTKTDADGRFVLENVEPGVRCVVCAMDRKRRVGGSVEVVPAESNGAAVNIQLGPFGTASGTVLSPRGRPLPGARITALARSGRRSWGAFASTESERNGRFVMAEIVPDVGYELRVFAAGSRLEKPLRLRLSAGEHCNLGDICLSEYGTTISGTVTNWHGLPIRNAKVICSVQDVFFRETVTNAEGRYVLHGLPKVDTAFVCASAPDYGRGYVQRARVGQKNVDFVLKRRE